MQELGIFTYHNHAIVSPVLGIASKCFKKLQRYNSLPAVVDF